MPQVALFVLCVRRHCGPTMVRSLTRGPGASSRLIVGRPNIARTAGRLAESSHPTVALASRWVCATGRLVDKRAPLNRQAEVSVLALSRRARGGLQPSSDGR
jgi:hypothetical protein